MKKLALVTLGLVLAAAVYGCAGAAKGPSDAELIQNVLADFKTYGQAKDLDRLMALYSDKFNNYEYGDKEGLHTFLQDAIDMGYLENAEINLANAKTKIEGEKATVQGIEMKAAFGSATIDLTLAKEASAWKIVGQDVQQY